jgi:vancomycin resistance protein YoaR
MGFLTRLSICVALLAGLGGAALWARREYLPDSPTLPGLRVGGAPTFGGEPEPVVKAQAEALLGRRVRVRVDDAKDPAFETTLGALGVRVDEAAIAAAARAVGRSGDPLGRLETTIAAREGRVDLPLLPTVDEEVAFAALADLKEKTDAPPASARLDLDRHDVIPERDGRYLDLDGAVAAILRVARDGTADEIVLPVATFKPRVRAEWVKTIDVHVVLAQFETYFSRHGDQARRAQNIENGARKLDGLVLSPHELVSFNAVVGDRSEENGFQKSWEIYKGEMVEGVGGGTCQVASTLHAAAFFGGLEVLERLPHSRPSAYIPMGLDSTVVYPAVDLKLRNPFDFPVVLHAKVDGQKLTMQLLGAKKPAKVTFERELVKTMPYGRKIEEDRTLYGNKVLVKQHGIRGYRIERIRTIFFEDGTKKVERSKDLYPPTTEIYKVPVGFDESLLPPLPAPADDEDGSVAPGSGDAHAGPPDQTNPAVATGVACAGECPRPSADGAQSSLTFVDAPGAHAPTVDQAKPKKTLKLVR